MPERISLADFWTQAGALDPAYLAASESVAAERAALSSVRREWIPSLTMQGLGNHGQRLSPSEERNLGVGPRGELRFLVGLPILDSDRGGRGEVAASRLQQSIVAADRFETTHRAALARLYIQAESIESLWELHVSHAERLVELATPVRDRIEAGLDLAWEAHLLDEAVARAERLLAEATQARDAIRSEFSSLVGRCVRPAGTAPHGELLPSEVSVEGSPEVQSLLSVAETHEALASAEAAQGRWRVELLGTAGPNHSRAFVDGPVRNEYLIGIGASWRPDFGGVRGQLATSERLRASAVQAEAASLRLALERELSQIRIELEHAERRRAGLERELEQAELRESAALLRWEAGVDRWTEVMSARERVLEVRTLEITLGNEMATALIRFGEVSGQMDDLPTQLGIEEAE